MVAWDGVEPDTRIQDHAVDVMYADGEATASLDQHFKETDGQAGSLRKFGFSVPKALPSRPREP